jgi:hypothetical protein
MSSFLSAVRVRPPTADPRPGQRVAAERYAVSVAVGIISEEGQMSGDVSDISVTGARIAHTGRVPPKGAKVRLGFSFFAHALPVPIHARVVRHTEDGGFAVEFEEVDFRTRILLRALLPNVSSEAYPADGIQLSHCGTLELHLQPVLLTACAKAAEQRGVPLEQWIIEQLENGALDSLAD